MIVTCPACSARYKINENKIKGRGAKITCPRCGHRFVVYRGQQTAPRRSMPDNVASLDFSTLGITWRVRKGIGVTWDFRDLRTLQDWLDEGRVDRWDRLSFDNRQWTAIEAIADLEKHFYDIWERARRGDIETEPLDDEPPDEDEDDSDAPTTIVGRGSSLASEIRQAVTAEGTPAPAHDRDPTPRPSPAAAASHPVAVGEPDDADEAIAMGAEEDDSLMTEDSLVGEEDPDGFDDPGFGSPSYIAHGPDTDAPFAPELGAPFDEPGDPAPGFSQPSDGSGMGDTSDPPSASRADAALQLASYDPAPLDPAYNDVVPTPIPRPGERERVPSPEPVHRPQPPPQEPLRPVRNPLADRPQGTRAPSEQGGGRVVLLGVGSVALALALVFAALKLTGVL